LPRAASLVELGQRRGDKRLKTPDPVASPTKSPIRLLRASPGAKEESRTAQADCGMSRLAKPTAVKFMLELMSSTKGCIKACFSSN